MNIPFSPPFIDEKVKEEVLKVLDSGWITTGPVTKELEDLTASKFSIPACLGVNSWTSGMVLFLKWWGIGEGDEVIIPAYTYAATALAVLHAGARPVIVDVKDDFTIDIDAIEQAITKKTKVIVPVDIGGNLADYEAINALVRKKEVLDKFEPKNKNEADLSRIMVLSDAAHSMGASYNGIYSGSLCDISIFSLHAVKNITAGEGGIICLNLPEPFNNKEIYPNLRRFALNGQTKDAFTKNKAGSWKYDIIERGMKCNLPDLNSALALGQLKQYDTLLIERKRVFDEYNKWFKDQDIFILPQVKEGVTPSYHIYPLRLKITEEQRDLVIQNAADAGIALNVHFRPLPELTLFKNSEDCTIMEYGNSLKLFLQEVSLPVYPQLTNESIAIVAQSIIKTVASFSE